jgi:hypothetical protein
MFLSGIKKNFGFAFKVWLCCMQRQHTDNQIGQKITKYKSLKSGSMVYRTRHFSCIWHQGLSGDLRVPSDDRQTHNETKIFFKKSAATSRPLRGVFLTPPALLLVANFKGIKTWSEQKFRFS